MASWCGKTFSISIRCTSKSRSAQASLLTTRLYPMSAAYLAVESTQSLDTRLVSRQQLNSISHVILRDNIKSKGAVMAVGWAQVHWKKCSLQTSEVPKANGCTHAIAA
jgi:hypothetical protein